MTDVAVHPECALNYISLCTGGGGLDLGVELAIPRARPILYVEREAIAGGHLVEAIEDGLLAPAPVWTDARSVPSRRFRGCVDFVFGGIPCQPHSVAGKQLGAEDERDLWSSARRVLVQSGAWAALIENVGGMLSTGGAYRVWRDLRRLGFAVEGGLFTASEVGAPHQRERIFLLGVADHARRGRRYLGERQHRPPCERADRGRSGPVADADKPLLQGQSSAGQLGEHEPNAGDGGCATGAVLANGLGLGLGCEGIGSNSQAQRREDARRSAGLCGRADLVDTLGSGRGRRSQEPVGSPFERTAAEWASELPLFPPGPADIAGWRAVLERRPEVEPALRGVADGLAPRVDQLRMLGNGVVPLAAAYALRTLATRLAARSAGAAELLRMMGEEA